VKRFRVLFRGQAEWQEWDMPDDREVKVGDLWETYIWEDPPGTRRYLLINTDEVQAMYTVDL
jgi:hypothetical protein